MTTIEWIETIALTPNRRNARTHSTKQIGQIAASIKTFGFLVPIVVDEPRNIIAGHGRYAAAQKLGLDKVPVIAVSGLSPAKKRALALADNKIAENAGWDREILAVELPELSELLVSDNLDISITGFAAAEIDQIIVDFETDTDGADAVDDTLLDQPPVTQPGQLWQLGAHRILCGDARDPAMLERLMDGGKAAMAFWIRPTMCACAISWDAVVCSTLNLPWPLAKCRKANSSPSSPRFCEQRRRLPTMARFIASAWTGVTSAICWRLAMRCTANRSILRSGSKTTLAKAAFTAASTNSLRSFALAMPRTQQYRTRPARP